MGKAFQDGVEEGSDLMCVVPFSFGIALGNSSCLSVLPLQLASATVGWLYREAFLFFKAECHTLIWFLA